MKLIVGIQLEDPHPKNGIGSPILRIEQEFAELPRAGDVVEAGREGRGGLLVRVVTVNWNGRTGVPWLFCKSGDGVTIDMARKYGFE